MGTFPLEVSGASVHCDGFAAPAVPLSVSIKGFAPAPWVYATEGYLRSSFGDSVLTDEYHDPGTEQYTLSEILQGSPKIFEKLPRDHFCAFLARITSTFQLLIGQFATLVPKRFDAASLSRRRDVGVTGTAGACRSFRPMH